MKSGRNSSISGLFLAAVLLLACAIGAGTASAQTTAATGDDATAAADPAQLLNPDTAASAIEIRETPHFGSIKIRSARQSDDDAAIVRVVLEDTSGLDALRKAIRGNSELMSALAARDKSVDDVISVTTDRNDDAIIFTRD